MLSIVGERKLILNLCRLYTYRVQDEQNYSKSKNLFRERTDSFNTLYIIIWIARRNYKKKDNYHGNCLTSLEAGSTGAINRLHHLVIVQYPIYIFFSKNAPYSLY